MTKDKNNFESNLKKLEEIVEKLENGEVDLGYSLLIILSIGFASGKLAIIFMRNLYQTSSLAKTGSIIEAVSPKKILFASLIWFVPVFSYLPLSAFLLGWFIWDSKGCWLPNMGR